MINALRQFGLLYAYTVTHRQFIAGFNSQCQAGLAKGTSKFLTVVRLTVELYLADDWDIEIGSQHRSSVAACLGCYIAFIEIRVHSETPPTWLQSPSARIRKPRKTPEGSVSQSGIRISLHARRRLSRIGPGREWDLLGGIVSFITGLIDCHACEARHVSYLAELYTASSRGYG